MVLMTRPSATKNSLNFFLLKVFKTFQSRSAETKMEKFTLKNKVVSLFQAYAEESPEEDIVYDDTKDLIVDDLEFSQKFVVRNEGPANVQHATIKALYPGFTKGGKALLEPPRKIFVRGSGVTIPCKVEKPPTEINPALDIEVTNKIKGNERRYSCAKKDTTITAAKCLQIICSLGPGLKEKLLN